MQLDTFLLHFLKYMSNLRMHDCGAEEAGRLYGLAAQGGSIEGMYSLGWMYAMGKGVPQNTSHAAALYKQAIEQAPDWQHAAPPFTALLLLPSLLVWQALHPFLPVAISLQVTGGPGTDPFYRQTLHLFRRHLLAFCDKHLRLQMEFISSMITRIPCDHMLEMPVL